MMEETGDIHDNIVLLVIVAIILFIPSCSVNNPNLGETQSDDTNNPTYMVRYGVNYDLPYPSKSHINISLSTSEGTQQVKPQGRQSVYYYGPYTKGQFLSVSFYATVPAPKVKQADVSIDVSVNGGAYTCVAHNSTTRESGSTRISVSTSYKIQ